VAAETEGRFRCLDLILTFHVGWVTTAEFDGTPRVGSCGRNPSYEQV